MTAPPCRVGLGQSHHVSGLSPPMLTLEQQKGLTGAVWGSFMQGRVQGTRPEAVGVDNYHRHLERWERSKGEHSPPYARCGGISYILPQRAFCVRQN